MGTSPEGCFPCPSFKFSPFSAASLAPAKLSSTPRSSPDPFFPAAFYDSGRSLISEGAGGFNPLKKAQSARPLGPDRGGRKQIQLWALQAAEKLILGTKPQSFVSGHDFSRAANVAKSTWALAPAKFQFAPESNPAPFSAACLAPEGMLDVQQELLGCTISSFLIAGQERRQARPWQGGWRAWRRGAIRPQRSLIALAQVPLPAGLSCPGPTR